jgi:CBS domain-containing protein
VKQTLVADVMQREVRTVRPSMSLTELEEVLLREHISGAPVIENGEVVGVVSRSDIVRQLAVEQARAEDCAYYLEPFDHEDVAGGLSSAVSETVAARLSRTRVTDVMIRSVITLPETATVGEAARCMLERRVHRLLVTDGPKLVGILSTVDLVRMLAEAPSTR